MKLCFILFDWEWATADSFLLTFPFKTGKSRDPSPPSSIHNDFLSYLCTNLFIYILIPCTHPIHTHTFELRSATFWSSCCSFDNYAFHSFVVCFVDWCQGFSWPPHVVLWLFLFFSFCLFTFVTLFFFRVFFLFSFLSSFSYHFSCVRWGGYWRAWCLK